MSRWWHRKVLKHVQKETKVSVPVFDRTARGLLVECSCGVEWAL